MGLTAQHTVGDVVTLLVLTASSRRGPRGPYPRHREWLYELFVLTTSLAASIAERLVCKLLVGNKTNLVDQKVVNAEVVAKPGEETTESVRGVRREGGNDRERERRRAWGGRSRENNESEMERERERRVSGVVKGSRWKRRRGRRFSNEGEDE
ncbi:hypothetical protein Sjap_013325 [Stephania japonica]|uniref:Uncharacterized protein n=1 Tax=Stephania japonica TaxID=461633 RepID=A0AAP0IZH6_9MAGN